MFIVYRFNEEFESWDYQCTIQNNNYDVLYSLIQLLEECDHNYDQYKLIEAFINNKRYLSDHLRIYYIENPSSKYGMFEY